MEEKMGDFGEWKAPEAQNAEKFESHPLPSIRSYDNNNYYYTNNNINNNNDEDEVFGEIVPIDTSNKRSYIVEDMMEWEAPIGDDRVGRGEAGVNGSIAERRAATRGFNAWGFCDPSINTAQFRSISPLTSPATRTPFITIPAGISPAALLDSPILLCNSQAHPSPTTGTFQLYSLNRESLMLDSVTRAVDGERGGDNSCINFQLHENPASLACISSIENKDFQFPVKFPSTAIKNSATEFSVNLEDSNSMIGCLASQSCLRAGNQMPVQEDPIDILEGNKEDIFSALGLAKTSDDGYNWRKYGQKQVKGSEFPRSYYKCTHPNCQVKKKVERSHDGEISEIIYNGAHDHPMPQPNPRSTTESSFSNTEIGGVKEGCCEVAGGGIVWRNIQPGYKDIKVGSDLRVDSKYVLSEDLNPISTAQTKSTGEFEVTGTLESSNKLVSQNDNDEDGSPFHKKSLNEDANLDESESKRRKTGSPSTETNVASRGAREPRVVVQIESEVDILDDGYRWRKYGQKVVKGNPNPRSYYKCTSAGCQVRKHVERACDNSKFVIMTYEGKHSHEVPAAKILTGSVTTLSPTTSSSQSTYALPRNSPEAHVQDLALRIPNLGDEFMRSAMLGNFGTDMKFGASSMYQMKFPPLQSSMPYGSLLMNPNSYGGMLDFPISFLYGVPGPADVVPGGVSMYDHEKQTGLAQSSIGGQQRKENDLGFIKPKQEKIEENHYDTHLSALDRKNASSSSLYCGVTKTFQSSL